MTAPPGGEVAITRVFTQDDFDRFATLSGDDNFIHVDADFAARTRFGATVAHGVLLVSVLHALTLRLSPGARLRGQDIRFPAPTYAGEPVEFQASTDISAPGRVEVRAARVHDGQVTCEGHFDLETG